MGNGTYEPPQGGSRVDYARASSQVSAPAIAMVVIAGLSILTHIASLVARLVGVSFAGLAGDQRAVWLLTGGLGIAVAAIGIVINAIIIFGALGMKDLRNYGLAMTAAILSIVPCSCCCLISLPIGVWSLVVLLDSNVKAAFRS